MAQDMDKNKHQSSNPGNQGNQSSNQGSQNNPGEQLRIEPRPGTGAFIFCSSLLRPANFYNQTLPCSRLYR